MAVNLTPAVAEPGTYQSMSLSEFEAELVSRGYGGYSQPERYRYINWGYMHVARLTRWAWEETYGTASVPAPEYLINLPKTFKSLDYVVVTTADKEKRVEPISLDEYTDDWLPKNLTLSVNRGDVSQYVIFRNQIVLLPPPDQTHAITVYYHRQPVPLVVAGDRPITPPHMDEAVMQGAIMKCAQRASDQSRYQLASSALDEILLQETGADGQRDQEELDEVVPAWRVI